MTNNPQNKWAAHSGVKLWISIQTMLLLYLFCLLFAQITAVMRHFYPSWKKRLVGDDLVSLSLTDSDFRNRHNWRFCSWTKMACSRIITAWSRQRAWCIASGILPKTHWLISGLYLLFSHEQCTIGFHGRCLWLKAPFTSPSRVLRSLYTLNGNDTEALSFWAVTVPYLPNDNLLCIIASFNRCNNQPSD